MNPQLSLDPVSDVNELLTYPFMVHALEAGTIVALMAGVAGWFMVLRRQSFAGHTLAVMSFPGASGAALAGLPLAAGYFGACAAASLAISAGSRGADGRDRSQESAVIGSVQVAGFALGFLFLSLYHGILESLESILFGSFLGITEGQVWTLLAVTAGTFVFFAVAGRPLLYASIDPAAARARGVPGAAPRTRLSARARAGGCSDGADHRRPARLRAPRRARRGGAAADRARRRSGSR